MNFNSPTVQALIMIEAETLRQFYALVLGPFCREVLSTSAFAECIERELRLGLAVCVLDAAERRMERAG